MNTETKLVRFDWAIKSLLRDKANFDILEGFLSAVLQEEIHILQILESESNLPDMEKKLNRVDVLVQDQQQRHVIIEVQSHQVTAYPERILFGVSKVIVDNIKVGEDYREISKVVSISILYFNLGLGDDYVYYGTTEFRGLHNNKLLAFRRRKEDKTPDKRQSQNVFPEYYLINVERFTSVIQNDLDEWIYLLKHAQLPPDCKAKNLDKAGDKLDVLKMNREERRHYEEYLMAFVNRQDEIDTARQEGKTEGKIEGKMEVAKELHKSGMNIETIASITGLSCDVIEQGIR